MENTEFPKLLFSEEDHMVVTLSQELGEFEAMREMRVRLQNSSATIYLIREEGKTRSLRLTTAELDALCTARANFLQAQQQAKEAEKERRKEVARQAMSIVREYPEIEVEPVAPEPAPAWDVSVPSIGLRYQRAAHGADDLLERVAQCRDALVNHKRIG